MNIRPYQSQMPRLAAGVYVDAAATVIGDVELGEDASVWPAAVIRGDVHRIRIGARTNVQDGAILHVTHDSPHQPEGFPLLIGADVTIGHGAVLHACVIEDACLIGMHASVLDGAIVRRHGFVGAGCLVAPGKIVGPGELWLGNPGR
ncbi:MAG: gamma carbonic anhydrase family protein, partial [Lysobacterales bacterium CG_4_9_14_3_um_filter_62_6]